MASDTEQPSTAVAVASAPARAAKVYEPVADVVPILDTARFEHMQRIATIMAGSSLIPDSLRQGGSGNDKYELSPATVVANCFLIVNQAVRWGMDPFAVAGSTSVVHGRLMYEGKLVAAVLESKLGLQLKYEFGTWLPESETVDLSKEGKGDLLGVRVSAQRAGDAEPVYIEGAVGIWKTAGNNSPWKPGAMKRQCRYRGAREWARAYNSGLMLGVITDDELDVLAERRETAQRLGARPSGGAIADNSSPAKRPLQAGFGDETDKIILKGGEKAEGTEGAGATAEAAEGAQGAAEGAAQGDMLSGADTEAQEREDHLITMYDLGAEAAGGGEAREAPVDLDDEEAERWLEGWDAKAEELAEKEKALLAETTGTTEAETQTEETEEEEKTTAPADEVYLIVGEGFSEAGRRKTYKNGFSHSSVTEKGAASLPVYDFHTPLPEKKEGSETAEKEPDQSSTASEQAAEPEADDSFPGDKPTPPAESSEEPNAFMVTNEKINNSASWLEIKQHLRDLSVTEAYKACEEEGKRMLRLWAYEAYKGLRESGKEAVEPTQDITLFRFWLEFDAESEEQIGSLFRALHRSPAYSEANDNDKRSIGALIDRKKQAIAEAKK